MSNPAGPGTPVGVYTLTPELSTRNYYVESFTGGSFQINPRLLTLDLPYYARYYGDFNPTFNLADVIVGGQGLASFDTIASLITDLHTTTPTDERTNTGYYRIDPTFAANPNYRYSWSPGYLAIVPRPVEVTVHDGVSFGGNNVPDGFNAAALGVNLITLDLENRSNPGTGYSASISNLPWFATDIGATNSTLYFVLSDTNETQKVGVATPLGEVFFPARPDRTPPVAASDPLPDTLPFQTISFTLVNPTPVLVDTPLAPLKTAIIFNNGNFLLDPTGAKRDTRFDDVIRYIIPRLSLGSNYVVTKVSNGKLTMKTDPIRMEQTLAAEALVAKRRAAEEEFAGGPPTTGISLPGTFGLTRDQYPLIWEAFANMLFDMINDGGTDPFLQALTGMERIHDINQITNDQMLFWLADIHTNPAKQAIMMPAMVAYGVKIAGLSPSQRSPSQAALVEKMEPYLRESRDAFLDKMEDARQAYIDLENQSGNLNVLMGKTVPYERFIESAVSDMVENSFSLLDQKMGGLSETEQSKLAGLLGGVAAGAGVGARLAQLAGQNVLSIFPKYKATIALAEQVADIGKEGAKAITKGSRVGSTATGVFSIVSVALTIAIDKAVAVAEEGDQKVKFDALLATRGQPVNAYDLSNTQQGQAMLTMGLLSMFGGVNP